MTHAQGNKYTVFFYRLQRTSSVLKSCIDIIFLEFVTYFLEKVPLPITNQNLMNPASLVLRVKKHQSKSVIKIFLSSFLPYFVDGWEVIGLKKPLGIL